MLPARLLVGSERSLSDSGSERGPDIEPDVNREVTMTTTSSVRRKRKAVNVDNLERPPSPEIVPLPETI